MVEPQHKNNKIPKDTCLSPAHDPGHISKKIKKVGDYKYDPSESGKVGEGAFGIVYKGKCISTNKSVAVKQIYLPDFPADFEKQLAREIQIAKLVDDTYNVKVYDVLKTDKNLYLISEYCNGGSLATFLKKNQCISEEEAIKYMRQVISGYKSLYKKNIIHRDIKPANLLFKDGKLKIADYGFAKIVDNTSGSKQKPNTILGTPLYMAPDVLEGNQFYDNTCDVWAFGFVFYEMLYGKLPWIGGSQYELYSNIIKNPLGFPDKPVVSKETQDLLKKMLKIKDRITWDELFEHRYFKKKSKAKQIDGQKENFGEDNNNDVKEIYDKFEFNG